MYARQDAAVPPLRRPATIVIGVLGALVLAACGVAASVPTTMSTESAHPTASGARPVSAPTSLGTGATSAASTTASTTSVSRPSPPSGVAWHVLAQSDGLRRATSDHGRITLLWLDPTRLRFRFVPGTRWPEGSPVAPADRAPSTWTSRMVAAFDGGFKLSDHVGGYYYRGRTVAALRPGLAAFTVTSDGALHVGVWGSDLHLTPTTTVVRENLPPIVLAGVDRARASDGVSTWGITLGRRTAVNRSALGRLADGGLVFLVGHDVTPTEVGAALVHVGVREAMMLDMNALWPTGYLYGRTGSHVTGSKIAGWIARPPSIYYSRFTKDFVVVSPRA
jgi:hypothetical protein